MYQTLTKQNNLSFKRKVKSNLPVSLKTEIERLSGMNLDHVHVDYNSPKPAQLNAYAYAQGTNIHVAPGRENFLPHEVWHVVQQMQGRVKAGTHINNLPVNNDSSLEKEADMMGAIAVRNARQSYFLSNNFTDSPKNTAIEPPASSSPYSVTNSSIQRKVIVLGGSKQGAGTSTFVIGLNLMPSISHTSLLHLKSRISAGGFGAAYAGHTSLISGTLNYVPPENLLDTMVAEMFEHDEYNSKDLQDVQGTGFSPSGLLNSVKVGIGGLPLIKQWNIFKVVPGTAHPDNNVTTDFLADQVVVRVSKETYDKWCETMRSLQGKNGVYTFTPDMNTNHNCGTWAIDKALVFCQEQLNTPTNLKDKESITTLNNFLQSMKDDISKQSGKPRIQGEMIKKVKKLNPFYV